MFLATIRPCIGCKIAWRKCSAKKQRCMSPPARCRIKLACGFTASRGTSSSAKPAATSTTTSRPVTLSSAVWRRAPSKGDFGVLRLEQLTGLVRGDNDHLVRTRLVCLENTHNRGSGRIQPYDEVVRICRWAHEQRLATHLDGARLFNAVVATGISARDWSQHFDTVSICFSKGLGAPIGSALAGPKDLIAKARRARKLFGGGMRQAGVIAAARAVCAGTSRRTTGRGPHARQNSGRGGPFVPEIPVAPREDRYQHRHLSRRSQLGHRRRRGGPNEKRRRLDVRHRPPIDPRSYAFGCEPRRHRARRGNRPPTGRLLIRQSPYSSCPLCRRGSRKISVNHNGHDVVDGYRIEPCGPYSAPVLTAFPTCTTLLWKSPACSTLPGSGFQFLPSMTNLY